VAAGVRLNQAYRTDRICCHPLSLAALRAARNPGQVQSRFAAEIYSCAQQRASVPRPELDRCALFHRSPSV